MFERYSSLPADALLGLITAFRDDANPQKVDLGVGVYKDESGNTPIMQAVKAAATQLLEEETSKAYIGPKGVPGFLDGMLTLVFGEQLSQKLKDRVASIQTPGGCGALRIGAELIGRDEHSETVYVSQPTWVNHIPLIESSGLKTAVYPYFDAATSSISFDKMLEALNQLGPKDIVLLHGCCHNPSGADLSLQEWQQVAEVAEQRGFIPFIDIAYQGLGDGLDDDVAGVRYLLERLPEVVIAVSCSKNFGLYRERTGCLMVLTSTSSEAQAVQTHIQDAARANYSMSPAYGGYLVDKVLNQQDLKTNWQTELDEMATRVRGLRQGLVAAFQSEGIEKDFSFITRQKGMFSFLGISKEQVDALKNQFGIYMAGSSRINVAGLNTQCLPYVAKAVASVLRE